MAHHSLFGLTREVFREFLTCPLCFEKYEGSERAAKFLPCLHGFCVQCLGQHAGDLPVFQCPICRRDTEVPADGVHAFPSNFIATKLKDLEHVVDVDLRQPHGLRCGACRDGGAAVSFCSDGDCLQFLCEECATQHGRFRIYEGHKLSSMEELQRHPDLPLPRPKPLCAHHRDQRLSLFCEEEQCQRVMCLVCSVTTHRNHRTIDLDQKCVQVKGELQRLAEVVSNKAEPIKEISGSITTEIQRVSTLFESRSNEMETAFGKLMKQLESKCEEVIAQMRQICLDRTAQLKSQADSAESLVSQLISASQFAERACEVGNPVDLLDTSEQIMSRLRELKALDATEAVPFQRIDSAFLSVTMGHSTAVRQIERHVSGLGTLRTSCDDAGLGPDLSVDFPGQQGSSFPIKASHRVRLRASNPVCPSFERLAGSLHAYLRDPDGSTVKCEDGKQLGDSYEIEFRPLVVGRHQLNISVSGKPVRGSPFHIEAIEEQGCPSPASGKSDGGDETISTELTWSEAFVDCPHVVHLKLRGHCKTEEIEVQYSMPDCERDTRGRGTITEDQTADYYQLSFKRKTNEAGSQAAEFMATSTYKIAYTPPAAGRLLMMILIAGQASDNSPLFIQVQSLYPDSTLISPATMGKCPPATAVLGMPYSVVLETRNRQKQRLTHGGFAVTAAITTSSSSGATQPYDVTDEQDGSYVLTFTPRCLKSHVVVIQICGYPVRKGMVLVISVQESLPFPDPPGGYMSPTSMAIDKERKLVYVADSKRDCIFRHASDGCSTSAEEIKVATSGKHILVAINSSGRFVTLCPTLRSVRVWDTTTAEITKWNCASENEKPATLTLSRTDHVVVGDTKIQALFIYDLHGHPVTRIQLPEGSLAAGMNNVCTDSKHNILVATHVKPFQILRYTAGAGGEKISRSPSPAKSHQLAMAMTLDDAPIVATLGAILVLDPAGLSIVKVFHTDDFFLVLAVDGDGCFVALDPKEQKLAKYCYAVLPQSEVEGDTTYDESPYDESPYDESPYDESPYESVYCEKE